MFAGEAVNRQRTAQRCTSHCAREETLLMHASGGT